MKYVSNDDAYKKIYLTSLEILSASIISKPFSDKIVLTELLPVEMPPVKPITWN